MVQRMPVILALIGLFAVQAVRPAVQAPTTSDFSISVNLVKVPISVFNENGDLVSDLRKEDFRVWEDQTAQDIRSFGHDTNSVSVVLLLDTSMSEKTELKKIKEAAEEFARALAPGDRISLITFDDEVYRVLDWTNDIKKLRKALGKIQPGLRTALYDAMYLAAADQLKGVDGRKAIILLTDCLNNQSSVDLHNAALSIVQSQASLYVVSKTAMAREEAKRERRVVMLSNIYKRMFGEDNYIEEFFSKREAEMTDLSERTGGRCFFPTDFDQIEDIYAEVAHELKSTYYLTYVSNQNLPPNSYHRISIEYLKPSSKLTYRKGYYYNLQRDNKIPNAAEFAIRK
jgi:Ca-activated chloride channel homolog